MISKSLFWRASAAARILATASAGGINSMRSTQAAHFFGELVFKYHTGNPSILKLTHGAHDIDRIAVAVSVSAISGAETAAVILRTTARFSLIV